MTKYHHQTRLLAAVDCIVFGFDGQKLKILLIQRGFEPEKNKWSLMGGFIQPNESADAAASRILTKLTGLSGVYLEQLHTFADPNRDPIERTLSIAYFALIDTNQYEKQISDDYHAEWFPLDKIPELIFDHRQMVAMAKEKLRYKASQHPILFELLPPKFTLPLVQSLFEDVFETTFDTRNFSRKIMSTSLLLKQKEKDKANSKKGAFYYKLDKKHYKKNFHNFLRIIPNPNEIV
ncbi:MAG TPA: NUDIX domain-containing protein [Ferruginibacter sp.]|nr:NUDIX domain-containing protein [Ferruginibacter sp.]HMP20451.1 NUDIX domain-containing protein [Ferruginibacter sp.]